MYSITTSFSFFCDPGHARMQLSNISKKSDCLVSFLFICCIAFNSSGNNILVFYIADELQKGNTACGDQVGYFLLVLRASDFAYV